MVPIALLTMVNASCGSTDQQPVATGSEPSSGSATTAGSAVQTFGGDLEVRTTVAEDVIRVGEPVHVTVTVTNRSSHRYEVDGVCGAPGAVVLSPKPPDPGLFGASSSLAGIPGPNFSTESASLQEFLRFGEQDQPRAYLTDRVPTSAKKPTEVCAGSADLSIPAGGSVSGTLTGLVSPGPRWPATSTLDVATHVARADDPKVSFDAASMIPYEDEPTRATAYDHAVAEAEVSPAVMGWVAAHQGPEPVRPAGGVPVDAEYRRGQWRIRMSANSHADANADLMITTEHGTGRIVDIRELRDGVEASNDPDALQTDPSKETVLYRA